MQQEERGGGRFFICYFFHEVWQHFLEALFFFPFSSFVRCLAQFMSHQGYERGAKVPTGPVCLCFWPGKVFLPHEDRGILE